MSLRTSDFIHASAVRTPDAEALVYQDRRLSYAELAREVETWSQALLALGIGAGERVAIYLEKRFESGGRDVRRAPPPAPCSCRSIRCSSPSRWRYILRDCNVRVLVTSPERLALLAPVLARMPGPAHVVVTGRSAGDVALPAGVQRGAAWRRCRRPAPPRPPHRVHRHRHGRDPLHLGQHRQAQGRRAVASQHGGRREERRVATSSNSAEDTPAGRAAAVVRRRLQPADDGLPCRRARRAAELPAAARRR